MPNHAASRWFPTSTEAASEPTTAPAPSAAVNVPTPGSPRCSRSTATSTVSTVTAPRVRVWTPSSTNSRRNDDVDHTTRAAATTPLATDGGGARCPGSSTSSPTVSQAERPESTATDTNPALVPPRARRAAAMIGPTRVESESSSPRTTFADASSPGVWHSSGSSAEFTGR
jgi:hypothetical protein